MTLNSAGQSSTTVNAKNNASTVSTRDRGPGVLALRPEKASQQED